MVAGRRCTGASAFCLHTFIGLLWICRSADCLFSLPGLEYTYDHLEHDLDGRTMMLHVNEHHATHIWELNKALLKHPDLQDMDLVTLNRHVGTEKIPADIAAVIRKHGGGHFNHNLFFTTMGRASNSSGPSHELQTAIDAAFGSLKQAKAQVSATALGVYAGWAWMVLKDDGNLTITSTPDHDNPLQAAVVSQPGIPILGGLDMWEHSYYLKFQHRRHQYIDAWWKVINWHVVNRNYALAKSGLVVGPQPNAPKTPA